MSCFAVYKWKLSIFPLLEPGHSDVTVIFWHLQYRYNFLLINCGGAVKCPDLYWCCNPGFCNCVPAAIRHSSCRALSALRHLVAAPPCWVLFFQCALAAHCTFHLTLATLLLRLFRSIPERTCVKAA